MRNTETPGRVCLEQTSRQSGRSGVRGSDNIGYYDLSMKQYDSLPVQLGLTNTGAGGGLIWLRPGTGWSRTV